MIDLDAKLEAAAKIIEGRVIRDEIAVFVKGSTLGFPCMLKAFSPNWPFGVNYFLNTRIVDDPSKPAEDNPLTMTILPRRGRGFFGFLFHILLFESRGQPVGDKKLEARYIFSYNDRHQAERFAKYPGISDQLFRLERYCRFSELRLKSDSGLFVSEPKSFASLDLDVCRQTFKIMAEIGQVLFEAF